MKIVITGSGCSPIVAYMAKLAVEACLSMRDMEIVVDDDFRPTYEPRKAIHEPKNFLQNTSLSGYDQHHKIGNIKKNKHKNIMSNQNRGGKSKQSSKKK